MRFRGKQIEMIKNDYETNDNAWWQCWSEQSDPCRNSRQSEGYFRSTKMISWNYTPVVFLACMHFWNSGLNSHSPLLLHHFYFNSYRTQAQLFFLTDEVKFLQEYIFSQVLFNEQAHTRSVPLVAFWKQSHCYKNTSLVVCTIFLTIFFNFFPFFPIFLFTEISYAPNSEEKTQCQSTALVTLTVVSLPQTSPSDKDANEVSSINQRKNGWRWKYDGMLPFKFYSARCRQCDIPLLPNHLPLQLLQPNIMH